MEHLMHLGLAEAAPVLIAPLRLHQTDPGTCGAEVHRDRVKALIVLPVEDPRSGYPVAARVLDLRGERGKTTAQERLMATGLRQSRLVRHVDETSESVLDRLADVPHVQFAHDPPLSVPQIVNTLSRQRMLVVMAEKRREFTAEFREGRYG
ncbi:hypothetical protein [Streptomyces sp. NPDC057702]|uniref:hypothetical protein n=1 Tax=unclassified Streptomyces TaxID=2593676 RepID=UPI00369B8FA6